MFSKDIYVIVLYLLNPPRPLPLPLPLPRPRNEPLTEAVLCASCSPVWGKKAFNYFQIFVFSCFCCLYCANNMVHLFFIQLIMFLPPTHPHYYMVFK